jgi:hypothetical protein
MTREPEAIKPSMDRILSQLNLLLPFPRDITIQAHLQVAAFQKLRSDSEHK